MIAYYDTENRRMVVASDYADKPTIIFREYNHHVLYSKIDLNSISSHDSYWAYYSIESGLASYFSCSYTNDPDAVGWNLENERKLSELKHNVSSAMADGTAIWGGAFWDLRKLVGKVVDKLLFSTWFDLQPVDSPANFHKRFVKKLLDNAAEYDGGAHLNGIREIFTRRGLKL